MTLTELKLMTTIKNILNPHEKAFQEAKEKDALEGGTKHLEMMAGVVWSPIVQEIHREGKIYVKEEQEAIEFIKNQHLFAKEKVKRCLIALEKLRNTPTPWEKSQDLLFKYIRAVAPQLQDIRQNAAQVRLELVKHQEFRGGLPTEKILNSRMHQDLTTIFLQYRDVPIKELANTKLLENKIEQFVNRAEQTLTLATAVKKQAQKSSPEKNPENASAPEIEGLVAALEKNATETAENIQKNITEKMKNLTDTKKKLKGHGKSPIPAKDLPAFQSSYDAATVRFKTAKSVFKTCRLLMESVRKELAGVDKDQVKTMTNRVNAAEKILQNCLKPLQEMDKHLKETEQLLVKVKTTAK